MADGVMFSGYKIEEELSIDAHGSVCKVVKKSHVNDYCCAVKQIIIPTKKQYDALCASMGEKGAEQYCNEQYLSIVEEMREIERLTRSGVHNIINYYESECEVSSENGYPEYKCSMRMEYLTPMPAYHAIYAVTVSDVVRLGLNVASALHFCHKRNITHGNIKDDNIFFNEESGEYKIGIFNAFRLLKNTELLITATDSFIAPEAYKNRKNRNESADLYSLGLVMYRRLNHDRIPFLPAYPKQYTPKDESLAFQKRIDGVIPEPPAHGGPHIGAVIIKAISNEGERYDKAEDFFKALEAAMTITSENVLNTDIKPLTNAIINLDKEIANVINQTDDNKPTPNDEYARMMREIQIDSKQFNYTFEEKQISEKETKTKNGRKIKTFAGFGIIFVVLFLVAGIWVLLNTGGTSEGDDAEIKPVYSELELDTNVHAPPEPEPTFVPVAEIINVVTEMDAETSLPLTSTVNPPYATNSNIVWSIVSTWNTDAELAGYILNVTNATDGGAVRVLATVTDGTAPDNDFKQEFVIHVRRDEESETEDDKPEATPVPATPAPPRPRPSPTPLPTPEPTEQLVIDPIHPLNANVPRGKVGESYILIFTLEHVNTTIWRRVSGNLPDGLGICPESGTILGRPTTAGTFTFTLSGLGHTFERTIFID